MCKNVQFFKWPICMLKSERANDLCGVFFMVRRYVMFVLNNNDAYFVIIEIYCCNLLL